MSCYYVYVLLSKKDGYWYTGYTEDLKARFEQHRTGDSKATRNRGPWSLIYYEASLDVKDAQARERYLKSGMGKRYIRNRLKNYLAKSAENL